MFDRRTTMFDPMDFRPWAFYDAKRLYTLYQTDDTSTPVTATGQTVGRWEDISGNARHALQATAGARPTFRDNVQGHRRVEGGINRGLLLSGTHDLSYTPAITLLVGYRSQDGGSNTHLHISDGTGTGTPRMVAASGFPAGLNCSINGNGSTPIMSTASNPTGYTFIPYVFRADFRITTATSLGNSASELMGLYQNQTKYRNGGGVSDNTNAGWSATHTISLCNNNDLAAANTSFLHHIIIYDKALTEYEMRQLWQWSHRENCTNR